ncbi:MAG TPA: hypothetical protein PLN52_10855 [Opitutaceae bacterium]|nr:hypothetical protein [Opitutaceae bacterium]
MPTRRPLAPGSHRSDEHDSSDRPETPPPFLGGDGQLPAPDALDDPDSPHYDVGEVDEDERDEAEFKPTDRSIRERRDDA